LSKIHYFCSSNAIEQVERDEADEILKKPVQNKVSVKTAIDNSTTRLAFINSNSVQDVLQTYPYLKHADLVNMILIPFLVELLRVMM
jgi:hypothetical protein